MNTLMVVMTMFPVVLIACLLPMLGYYNPHDAAVIVPKRYGTGWTLNFARPVAWVYLGGVLVVALAAGVVPLLVRK